MNQQGMALTELANLLKPYRVELASVWWRGWGKVRMSRSAEGSGLAPYLIPLGAALLWTAKVLLYLLLFMAPFAPRWVLVYRPVANLMPEFSSTLFYLTDVLLIVVVVLWLAAHLLDHSRPMKLGPWFTTLPLAVLVVLSGLSCMWATSKVICVEAFLRLAWLWVLYLLVHNEISNEPLAAGMLAAGMVVQSVMAMLQFDRQAPVGLFFLGETRGPPMDWFRGYGFSPHPNILGGYLAVGLAVALALALGATRDKVRMAWSLAFGIGVGGLVATFSRAAWLGITLGFGLAALVIWLDPVARARRGRVLILLGGVGVAVLVAYGAVAPHCVLSRLVVPVASKLGVRSLPDPVAASLSPWYTGVEQTILEERQEYTQVALRLIEESLPLGVGATNFGLASYLLEPDRPAQHLYAPAHNVLLLMTAELGPVGGLTWVFLLLAFLAVLWHRRKELAQNAWFLGWSVAVLCLLTTSFFDYYIWGWQQGRILFWAVAGLWAGSYSRLSERSSSPPNSVTNAP
jgi:hypothetical protein